MSRKAKFKNKTENLKIQSDCQYNIDLNMKFIRPRNLYGKYHHHDVKQLISKYQHIPIILPILK